MNCWKLCYYFRSSFRGALEINICMFLFVRGETEEYFHEFQNFSSEICLETRFRRSSEK